MGVVALFLLAPSVKGAEMGSNILLPLPEVAIPPVQGKTLGSDLFEIDQDAHLLYIADRTDHGVDVFDIRTPSAKYMTTIPTGEDPNGVILAKNVNKLVMGGANSDVVIVDADPMSPHHYTVIARLNTGGKKRVDEGDYDPVEKKVYIANSDDGIITVVDVVANKIIKKWTDMGEGLEQPRYNPGDGMMYMTSSDQNTVFTFNPRNDTLVTKTKVSVACNPNGLAINPKTGQALLGCSDKKSGHTVLWDLKGGKVITTFSQIWAGDQAVYNAKDNLFFFAASNQPNGAQVGVFTGGPNVRYVGGAPTYAGSHGVGYDQTNRVVYVQDQRPNSAGLLAFFLSSVPK
jgi:DNA-binding beta-propeller fold protein YncE